MTLPLTYQHLSPRAGGKSSAATASDPLENNQPQQQLVDHSVTITDTTTCTSSIALTPIAQPPPTGDYPAEADSQLQNANTPPLVIPTFAPSKKKKIQSAFPLKTLIRNRM